MKRKKTQTEYLPLRFVNSNKEYPPGEAFSSITAMLSDFCALPDDLKESEYVSFLSSSDFLSPSYSGKFLDMNRLLINNADVVRGHLGVAALTGNIFTEMKDVYLFPVLLDRWVRYKQVYRIDKDFADALLSTDNVTLSKEMIRRVPYKNFYIDLEKCERFAPIKGLFVHVANVTEEIAEFAVYLLSDDLLFFSQYITGHFDDNGIMSDDASYYGGYIPYRVASGEDINGGSLKDMQIGRQRISFFALQLISYLTSKEPDTEPDLSTNGAKPVLPGTHIRNKFSEVTRHEVGVRVGNRIRVAVNAMSESKARVHLEGATKHGTPKIPHVRAAHWSHYWTGKGRKVYETRWIEPCFINCGAEESVKVTLHDVG